MRLNATGEHLLCINGDFGEKVLSSGIIIPNDDAKESGIRSRWFQVLSMGPRLQKHKDLKPGYWVIVKHGRWTNNIQLPIDDYREQLAEVLNCEQSEVESRLGAGSKYSNKFMFWKVDFFDGVLGYYPGTDLPSEYFENSSLSQSLRDNQKVYTAKQSSSQSINRELGEV